jgi:hypothetical protein
VTIFIISILLIISLFLNYYNNYKEQFYFEVSPQREKCLKEQDLAWLLEGAIDKPCFYITYKSDKDSMKLYPTITHLKDVGCFSFYQRLPAADNGSYL